MNKTQYIKRTVKLIKCGSSKKKEIQKQLETDIEIRLEQGESLDRVLSEMGSPQEIAESFNENLSENDRRKYRQGKMCKIIIPIVIVLAILSSLVYWIFPKPVAIEKSKHFDKAQVENAMKETITLLDNNDYTALRAMSIPQMDSILTEDTITAAKNNISADYGEQISYGSFYIVEIIQFGTHYAVGEVTVSYENANATYRLSYDEDLKLAGLYIR